MGAASDEKADMVVVSCPLCAFNLDNRQDDAKRLNSDFQNMPVLYFTQLMAVALGLPEAAWGMGKHYVEPSFLKVYSKQ